MRFRIIVPALALAGGIAFVGAASAESLTVIPAPTTNDTVVVEHEAPPAVVVDPSAPPAVVIEHPAPVLIERTAPEVVTPAPVVIEEPPSDCASRKVVEFHPGGGTTTHVTTDCD